MLQVGSLVDNKYKILSEVGHGGMSVVYLAINERANKTWAVKEIRKDGVCDFEAVKQGLVVETDMLKRLNPGAWEPLAERLEKLIPEKEEARENAERLRSDAEKRIASLTSSIELHKLAIAELCSKLPFESKLLAAKERRCLENDLLEMKNALESAEKSFQNAARECNLLDGSMDQLVKQLEKATDNELDEYKQRRATLTEPNWQARRLLAGA